MNFWKECCPRWTEDTSALPLLDPDHCPRPRSLQSNRSKVKYIVNLFLRRFIPLTRYAVHILVKDLRRLFPTTSSTYPGSRAGSCNFYLCECAIYTLQVLFFMHAALNKYHWSVHIPNDFRETSDITGQMRQCGSCEGRRVDR